MDEVDKHLKKFAPNDLCPHPICKSAKLAPPNVMAFENHIESVHKNRLRP